MQDFWDKMNGFDLPPSNHQELDELGFTVIPGPVPVDDLAQLVAAYDAAVSAAISDDVKVASSTTRVRDFVNRSTEFDSLYLHPPVLKACCHIIGRPFRLSTMHARTLRPGLPAQDLHVDYERDSSRLDDGGFHLHDRRVPKRQRCDSICAGLTPVVEHSADLSWGPGPEGRLSRASSGLRSCWFHNAVQWIIWHGHTVNDSGEPRRSIQGAYIRRDAESGENLLARSGLLSPSFPRRLAFSEPQRRSFSVG